MHRLPAEMKNRENYLENVQAIHHNLFRYHPFVQKTAMEMRRHFNQVCLSSDMYNGYLNLKHIFHCWQIEHINWFFLKWYRAKCLQPEELFELVFNEYKRISDELQDVAAKTRGKIINNRRLIRFAGGQTQRIDDVACTMIALQVCSKLTFYY